MIIIDESIDNASIIDAVAAWYPGRVLSIRALRPATLILDETIPTLLHRMDEPTFVTINVDDFWKKAAISRKYCIVALELEQGRALALPILLRRLLRLSEFHTKAARMGKIIRVRSTSIEYYSMGRQVETLAWND